LKDVALLQWDNGPYILAPEHCPYKNYMNGTDTTVHPSMCPLCKMCNFISGVTEISTINATEVKAFQEYLSHSNKQVSSSLLAQIQFLRKNDRIPIAILVSDALLGSMLSECIEDPDRRSVIKSILLNKYHLICYVAGSPTYYSRKLTKSNIQAVGEIEWK